MEMIEPYIPYAMVAAGVVAGLIVLTLLFRAFAGRRAESDALRLGVTEHLEIDKQRRLVLVRRDNVEHLLLIGGAQDVVVETAIRPGAEGRMPAAARIRPDDRLEPEGERAQGPARPVALRSAPRPAVFGERTPATDAELRAEPRLEPVKASSNTGET